MHCTSLSLRCDIYVNINMINAERKTHLVECDHRRHMMYEGLRTLTWFSSAISFVLIFFPQFLDFRVPKWVHQKKTLKLTCWILHLKWKRSWRKPSVNLETQKTTESCPSVNMSYTHSRPWKVSYMYIGPILDDRLKNPFLWIKVSIFPYFSLFFPMDICQFHFRTSYGPRG